jgi:hypothetical protein
MWPSLIAQFARQLLSGVQRARPAQVSLLDLLAVGVIDLLGISRVQDVHSLAASALIL